jgi:Mn-dependent DtxR family transcriptional regulator
MFKPVQIHVRRGMGWKAADDTGACCLHEHASERTAQRCCDQLNKPTLCPGTPRGAYEYAAGYHD